MSWLKKLIDLVLHLDAHLDTLILQFGPWIYVILFLIVFCETGLVVTPILPGDSLLFAIGALAARGSLNLYVAVLLLIVAAILGDTVNYLFGRFLGQRLIAKFPKLIKAQHLERTHAFYERYGGKTIIIARFVPIVRTFAPFVAGLATMQYRKFMSYNVVGGLLWIGLLVPAGYIFGNVPIIRKNFSLVVIGIVVVSMLPAVFEFWRERRRLQQSRQRPE